MKKTEKVVRIAAVLDELYPLPKVPLIHRDPYQLLVATVLSAQCTDKRVNQVTPSLFSVAGTAREMAEVPERRIHAIIKPCGLANAKAKALLGLSRVVVEKHGGNVPETFEALEELPGVGHKTASVVMAQAFGVPAFPVDTHIHRLAARWGLSDGRSVVQTERDLKKLFPRENWNKLHLQFIYFGREYCPARGHDPSGCPICSFAAFKSSVKNRQTSPYH